MGYLVMVKILGGEWKRHQINGVDFETDDLATALGMKATVEDEIREAIVMRVSASMVIDSDYTIVTKRYQLVE